MNYCGNTFSEEWWLMMVDVVCAFTRVYNTCGYIENDKCMCTILILRILIWFIMIIDQMESNHKLKDQLLGFYLYILINLLFFCFS